MGVGVERGVVGSEAGMGWMRGEGMLWGFVNYYGRLRGVYF